MEFPAPPRNDFDVHIEQADIDFYRENGYLAYERMTTPEELEWLCEVYDALLAQPRSGFLDTVFDLTEPYGYTEPPKLGQLLFPERLVEAIRDTAMWRNARRTAARLLDVPIGNVEHWGHLIFKQPGARETPWHQDEAYWSTDQRYHAVGAWMPLQDVDVDNGCLWFLPGTHHGDVHVHRHLNDDPAIHILEVVEAPDVATAVPVPLKAGGMTFHHPRLLHYSRPNGRQSIRRAWANEFQTAPVQRDVPADRPWVEEGHDALVSRWKDRRDS